MKCQQITRKAGKLSPFIASTCPGKLRKGSGGMYISSERAGGIGFRKTRD